ncbi:MAG: hypothetical protein GWN58_32875 [Anaerolineae bacterium]|nr:hypothetical protein [Thermoplasmata archaeon]NIV34069.1 hypothetical protein [Anaerolineae bacterium]NIY05920.1 hypothetical protein [Thermoplasmata archaeon]
MITKVSFTCNHRGQVNFEVHVNPRLAELDFKVGRFAVFCTGDVLAADAFDVLHQDMVQRSHYALRGLPAGELERIDILFAGTWRRFGDDYGVQFQDFGLPYSKLRPRLTTWREFVGRCKLVARHPHAGPDDEWEAV